MKSFLFIIFLHLTVCNTFAQDTAINKVSRSYKRLMIASKVEKTTGVIVTAGGFTAVTYGLAAIILGEAVKAAAPNIIDPEATNPGWVITGAGLVAGVAGILLWKEGYKNKRKALNIKTTNQAKNGGHLLPLPNSVPSITVSFSL